MSNKPPIMRPSRRRQRDARAAWSFYVPSEAERQQVEALGETLSTTKRKQIHITNLATVTATNRNIEMPTCINMRSTYGDKYRIDFEESYYADHGARAYADDPWLQIIPCQHGHIGPFCSNRLFASTDRSGSVAKALRALDCVEVWQDGTDGLSVMFYPADFKRVAAVMKPKRKRQLSPERRAALVEAGKANRFPSASDGVNASPRELERNDATPVVQSRQPMVQTILALE